MTFYARLQATANRLLKGKGQSLTLTKVTAGTYNPATGGFGEVKTATRANTKISAVDGSAFVDFSESAYLTLPEHRGCKLTITDSAGKKLVGYIKAQGAGETYGGVYACVFNGDIYKQTGGTGDFVGLSQTTRNWRGMAAAPNGDVYACVYGGDIYKQAGGTGAFQALNQTTRNWTGMAAAPNGDVYASVFPGDIYKQTGGAGDFEALEQTTRNWWGMAAAPNGDVYASVYNGDIYKQAGGAGNFVALGQTSRNWYGMAAAPNGDVYASVFNGDIYKQSGGAGAFVALNQTTRSWLGMAAAPNGDVYACDYPGDIYKQTGGTGDFEALGQTSRYWYGMAASPNWWATGVTITSTPDGSTFNWATKEEGFNYNDANGYTYQTGAGTSTQMAYGAIFDYGTKQIDGTLIKAGDKQLLLSAFKTDGSALTAPVLGDTVSIGGVTYTLVEPLKEVNPAGTTVMYECNLRA